VSNGYLDKWRIRNPADGGHHQAIIPHAGCLDAEALMALRGDTQKAVLQAVPVPDARQRAHPRVLCHFATPGCLENQANAETLVGPDTVTHQVQVTGLKNL